MPFYELLAYLASIGDGLDVDASEKDERLTTKNGLVYVRAREGQTFDGYNWHAKYIWVRV